ncbi:MAG TPA: RagB/SusD family nutrient uptake outer membrane protein, partial [Puia sp.]|nr:RagB/SusD family nutrient uptake outer membrane protein [Puia sp.]
LSPGLLAPSQVYTTDASATSAVLTLYSYYPTTNSLGYFTYAGGLAADELQTSSSTADLLQFAASSVTATNTTMDNYLWIYPYQVIREANQAIAGLNASTSVSAATKSQLLGEALFFRAFYFFHLVNYFGPVPLTLNTTEIDNAAIGRTDTATLYAQMITDLKQAESLLPSAYVTTLHARVNKYAAAALLARIYLYTNDYPDAETEATKVIGATDVTYSLPAPASTFVNTSPETILQFATLYGYSMFGAGYRTTSASTPPTYYLFNNFVGSFESGDLRRSAWIDSAGSGTGLYYRINKYKLATATAGNEYNVVLRLAEQYLIRAEARAHLYTDLTGAKADLNTVRARAGLGATTATTSQSLLTAILQERKVELFGESAHRWFDLKRTGQANTVLGAAKPSTWQPTAVLLPIPQTELLLNNKLTQNPGY